MVAQEILAALRDVPPTNGSLRKPAMFILRGLPGSGKSTLADEIERLCYYDFGLSCGVCSADHAFMAGGQYFWNRQELGRAHMTCEAVCREFIRLETDVIVVDNSNIRTEDYKKYFELGYKLFYEPVIVEFVVKDEDEALEKGD